MHQLPNRIVYILLPAIFTFLLIIECGKIPSNPYYDYDNANIELLPVNVPAQGFRVGDTVTFSVIMNLPQLFSSITVSANDIIIQGKIDSSGQNKDTCLIRQCFNEPDTYYLTVNGILNNNEKRITNGKLIINGIPPVITKDLKALNYVKTGTACTLSVAATGSAPLQYSWYHDNTILAAVNNDSLIIPLFDSANAGVYSCIVRNNWGNDASTPALLLSSDTTHGTAYWVIDTLRDSLSEGDSIAIRLSALYNKQISQSVAISLAGQNSLNVSVTDSLFKFKAGHRDSGDYVFPLILSDSINSLNNDILPVLIKVKPRYFQISITADSGSVALLPQLNQYRWSDTIQVKAIPAAGFIFHQWDGDFSGSNDTITLVITKTISGFARFWPTGSAVCDNVADTRLADAILFYSNSSSRPKQLCPVPGVYNKGSLKINGGVRFVLQK